jgi:hypothetical protein
MANLILVVISIALMVAVIMATVPTISADAMVRQSIQREADYGIRLLEAGTARYLDSNRDPQGNIIYPGDGVNLKGAIAPAHGFFPSDVRGELTWSVRTGGFQGLPAVAICVFPIAASTDIQRSALEAIQRKLPQGSAVMANACGATTNSANGTALTYWMVVSHLN